MGCLGTERVGGIAEAHAEAKGLLDAARERGAASSGACPSSCRGVARLVHRARTRGSAGPVGATGSSSKYKNWEKQG